MFQGPYTILIILVITMALFIWGYWRYDIVAAIALMLATLTGAVPFSKVYTGFSNPAVITVACVMIISQVITRSGAVAFMVRKITVAAKYHNLYVIILCVIAAILSAFMNNVGALALMMLVALRSSLKMKRSASLVLMPLALASAMGGLVTMIGTPPNLLISFYREQSTGQPFALFDYARVGFYVALAGVLFIALIGWRLLPRKRKGTRQPEDLFQIEDYLTEIKIPEKSPTIDKSIREFEKLIEAEFSIIGLIRKGKKHFALSPDEKLQPHDVLIVEISSEDLQELLQAGKIELVGDKKISSEVLKSKEVGIVEAVVPPGSRVENRSAESIRLRARYRLNLLAIARQGNPFRERLREINFRAGDVVLLQGPVDVLEENVASLGFLPLLERGLDVGMKRMAFLPIIIFIFAIFLAGVQWVPVEVAFGGAVILLLLFRLLPTRLIYESIDWPVIILLGAMIPVGEALQSTGGTTLIAHFISSFTKDYPPFIILGLVMIITMTLSDFMNNAATAVVMAPIGVSIAHSIHASVDPFLMAVAIAASCSFLTPIGHQNNALVMGPGGYKFFDYIRLGLPLEIVVLVLSLPLILWAWPLS
ncbi:SLC13 family permease [Coxiella burnetii]|uniref:Transporter, divalent anion:sodium symporter family n=2 Tax=Coxiella burnetii TaxID=777 RepID=Q83CP3_COXBU|nr:SLC13 family permease [Coxiella burnetii]NP_820066.1 divalent anion:sodium symporter family transporter [Coxiella burnetii RSA 493]AAO90580.1 transporter, divalent anion:sodium symporter family [Coxiella burnetii RSA 493]ARI65881.1 SLC13 family permease [Coxiella burnetii]ATN74461.1 transporter [Coxiella burnetii]ATN76363.1 transporter [Coxiella burnetii]ATN78279.1 transporter [Coxiella burnetii]